MAALNFSAEIVADHGKAYLPVFERLEAELAELEAKESALERARAVAAKSRSADSQAPGIPKRRRISTFSAKVGSSP